MSIVINTPKEDAEEEIDRLIASPSFCLSLGSREHFQSDILYWLGRTYPGETGRKFACFLGDRSGDCCLDGPPQREKQNIDLWFRFRNGSELIVENKVKAIPHEEKRGKNHPQVRQP